jgi:hypothetical protein
VLILLHFGKIGRSFVLFFGRFVVLVR